MLHLGSIRGTSIDLDFSFLILIPLSPLDGGSIVRNFFRIFLRERTAFVISVWIGMIAGVLVVVYAAFTRNFFVALFIGSCTFTAYQQWQYFRQHGYPGD